MVRSRVNNLNMLVNFIFVVLTITLIRQEGYHCASEDFNEGKYGVTFEFPQNDLLQTVEGKARYEVLKNKIPQYGKCWAKAVEDLHVGCRHLTEDTQSRLALAFANCFLLKAGMKGYTCPSGQRIEVCMQTVDERTFSTYREFFTHTQSICLFLQSQMWQRQVENTISSLSTNSKELNVKLEHAKEIQAEMLTLQNLTINEQKQLRQINIDLKKQIEQSKNSIKDIFDDLKAATSEHRIVINEIFDRISKLNTLVLGGVVNFYTVVFYAVSTVISYLFSSTPRTQAARFWLFMIMTLNAIMEKIITAYSIEEESREQILLDDTGPVYYRIQLCRNASCVIAVITLICFALSYKDYNLINNQLLADIHCQNAELKNCLREMGNSFNSHLSKGSISSDSDYDETYSTTSSDESDSYTTVSSSSAATEISSANSNIFSSDKIHETNSEMLTVTSRKDSTPMLQQMHSPYNLRRRPNRPAIDNLILQNESPETFQCVVENLRRISLRNSRIIRDQHACQTQFSEDEQIS